MSSYYPLQHEKLTFPGVSFRDKVALDVLLSLVKEMPNQSPSFLAAKSYAFADEMDRLRKIRAKEDSEETLKVYRKMFGEQK